MTLIFYILLCWIRFCLGEPFILYSVLIYFSLPKPMFGKFMCHSSYL